MLDAVWSTGGGADDSPYNDDMQERRAFKEKKPSSLQEAQYVKELLSIKTGERTDRTRVFKMMPNYPSELGRSPLKQKQLATFTKLKIHNDCRAWKVAEQVTQLRE